MDDTDRTVSHLFAGGGGDVAGFAAAGFRPLIAVNHDQDAVQTLRTNFGGCRARQADINNLDMRSLPRTRYLVGSPICTEAAPASGLATPTAAQPSLLDGEEDQVPAAQWNRTRATAYDLLRAAEVHRYEAITWENVPRFASWILFDAWLRSWQALGYGVQLVSVDAAHLGAPQHRHRLLGVFTRKGVKVDLRVKPTSTCATCGIVRGIQKWSPGRRTGTYRQQYRYVCPNRRCGHAEVAPVLTPFRDAVDWDLPGRLVAAGRARRREHTPYEAATLARIETGLRRYGGAPFLAVLRRNCTVQSLDGPVGTITAAGNHHMLVLPGADLAGTRVRMLTSREKARAQTFPDTHQFAGSSTAQGRQIGNAVAVTVARWLAERLATAA